MLFQKILLFFCLFNSWQFSFAQNVLDLERQARGIVSRMGTVVPIKSGRDMTLISVEQAGIMVLYNHTIDASVPPENFVLLADWLRGQSNKSACSVEDLVRFVRSGGALHYRFYSNGMLISSVKIDRC